MHFVRPPEMRPCFPPFLFAFLCSGFIINFPHFFGRAKRMHFQQNLISACLHGTIVKSPRRDTTWGMRHENCFGVVCISKKWVIAWKMTINSIKSWFTFSIQLQTNSQSWKSFGLCSHKNNNCCSMVKASGR